MYLWRVSLSFFTKFGSTISIDCGGVGERIQLIKVYNCWLSSDKDFSAEISSGLSGLRKMVFDFLRDRMISEA